MTIPKRIAAGIAAAALITALGSTTAAYASTPATSPVPCGSSLAWLKLFATTAEHCYTGNGTTVVDLTVREMQIIGYHEVCLRFSATAISCYLGSGTVFLSPARFVEYVFISTPLPRGKRERKGKEMIERFTRKGLVTAVAGIASAASVAAALAFATPAMAATAAPVTSGVSVSFTETGQLTITQVNATTYCGTTPVDAVHGYVDFGITVWWVKMQTRWCWNGSTVTSHSTSVQHWTDGNTTFYGAPLTFTCPNGCRENSESISKSPMFSWWVSPAGVAWNVHLWQNEFYNGSWNAGWSATHYPF